MELLSFGCPQSQRNEILHGRWIFVQGLHAEWPLEIRWRHSSFVMLSLLPKSGVIIENLGASRAVPNASAADVFGCTGGHSYRDTTSVYRYTNGKLFSLSDRGIVGCPLLGGTFGIACKLLPVNWQLYELDDYDNIVGSPLVGPEVGGSRLWQSVQA